MATYVAGFTLVTYKGKGLYNTRDLARVDIIDSSKNRAGTSATVILVALAGGFEWALL